MFQSFFGKDATSVVGILGQQPDSNEIEFDIGTDTAAGLPHAGGDYVEANQIIVLVYNRQVFPFFNREAQGVDTFHFQGRFQMIETQCCIPICPDGSPAALQQF